jgi:hypothetical protein
MQFKLKRREFITLLGGVAAWPAEAWGQQPGKLPSIGVLGGGTMTSQGPWLAAFVQRLGELGWIERRTINFDIHWAEGRPERLAEIATELVRLNVDVMRSEPMRRWRPSERPRPSRSSFR